jgi:hypothetical protein
MNWTTSIYWLTRLDNIGHLFSWILGVSIVCVIAMLVYRGVNTIEDNDYKKKPWLMGIFIFLIVLGALGKTFTPTTKEAIFIVAGGKTLEYMAKDTSLNKIPGQVTTITSTWLEKKLNEIESDVKKQVEGTKK